MHFFRAEEMRGRVTRVLRGVCRDDMGDVYHQAYAAAKQVQDEGDVHDSVTSLVSFNIICTCKIWQVASGRNKKYSIKICYCVMSFYDRFFKRTPTWGGGEEKQYLWVKMGQKIGTWCQFFIFRLKNCCFQEIFEKLLLKNGIKTYYEGGLGQIHLKFG